MCSVYGRTILAGQSKPEAFCAIGLRRDAGDWKRNGATIEPRWPMPDATERFLCIASYEKGQDFLRQCAEMGVKPTLLTLEKLRDADWPREALEELVTMPSGLNREQILNTVSWMARGRRFDRIVALDEFDLEKAAQIREHMRIPGMGTTTAGCYRDKLAMRVIARGAGLPGSGVLPGAELRRAARLHGARACAVAAEAALARPRRWGFAGSKSRSSCGAFSTTWATSRATTCWNSLCPATSFTWTRS